MTLNFVIRRTSTYKSNPLPFDERIKKTSLIYHDYRTVSTLEEMAEKDKNWLKEGSDHRVVSVPSYFKGINRLKTMVVRNLLDESYLISFQSLEEFYQFIKDNMPVIIDGSRYVLPEDPDHELEEIEIYDDYRE